MLQEGQDVRGMSDEDLDKALRGEEQTQPVPVADTEKSEEVETVEPAVIDKVEQEVETVVEPKKTEPVDQNRETVGLRKDLVGERERRRLAEAQLAELNARLALLEKKSVPAPVDPLDSLDDDAIVEGRSLKEYVRRQKELEQKLLLAEQAERNRSERAEQEKREKSEEVARQKYSVDKTGEGLDYDTIIRSYAIPLIERNPEAAQMIMRSANPAETAYKLGFAEAYDPFTVKASKPAVAQTVKKSAPVTLGQAQSSGGTEEDLSKKDISKMTDVELDKYLRLHG